MRATACRVIERPWTDDFAAARNAYLAVASGRWILSLDADEVLANDLDHSGVFNVTRAWVAGQQPFDVQAFVGGKWAVAGGQVRLTGQVLDFPAKRPILVRDYTGLVAADHSAAARLLRSRRSQRTAVRRAHPASRRCRCSGHRRPDRPRI